MVQVQVRAGDRESDSALEEYVFPYNTVQY